jgi:CheY-like chemotaxis protein
VSALDGLRVLIAEDEMLVSMLLEEMLDELGCSVLGTAASIEAALSLIETLPEIDAAVLDLNLAGRPIEPVAETLQARGVPILFVTGYGAGTVNDRFPAAKVLQKPFQLPALEQALMAYARPAA